MIESQVTTHHGEDSRWAGIAKRDDKGWHPEPHRGADWKTCAHCGSLPPDVLIELRDAGRLMSRDMADWKYGWPHKIYVDVAPADPSLLYVVSASNHAARGPYAPGGEHFRPPGPDEIPWDQLTDEQREIVYADGMARRGEDRHPDTVTFSTRSALHGKYYLIHGLDQGLSDQQREQLAQITGYWIEDVGDGRFRWRAYDFAVS